MKIINKSLYGISASTSAELSSPAPGVYVCLLLAMDGGWIRQRVYRSSVHGRKAYTFAMEQCSRWSQSHQVFFQNSAADRSWLCIDN